MIKWIIAFTLIIALIGAVVCLSLKAFGVFDKQQDAASEEEDYNSLVVESQDFGGMKIAATAVAAAEGSNETLDLELVTDPVNAAEFIEEPLSWSVEFANPQSEWATGKDINEYMTVLADESIYTKAVATCLQPFGEQIIVKASGTLSGIEMTATATIDYEAKLENVAFPATPFDYTTMCQLSFGVGSIMPVTQKEDITISSFWTGFRMNFHFLNNVDEGRVSENLGQKSAMWYQLDNKLYNGSPLNVTITKSGENTNVKCSLAFGSHSAFNTKIQYFCAASYWKYSPFALYQKSGKYYYGSPNVNKTSLAFDLLYEAFGGSSSDSNAVKNQFIADFNKALSGNYIMKMEDGRPKAVEGSYKTDPSMTLTIKIKSKAAESGYVTKSFDFICGWAGQLNALVESVAFVNSEMYL